MRDKIKLIIVLIVVAWFLGFTITALIQDDPRVTPVNYKYQWYGYD